MFSFLCFFAYDLIFMLEQNRHLTHFHSLSLQLEAQSTDSQILKPLNLCSETMLNGMFVGL